jgi:hypothetical protein
MRDAGNRIESLLNRLIERTELGWTITRCLRIDMNDVAVEEGDARGFLAPAVASQSPGEARYSQ